MNLIYELSIKEAKQLPDFSGTDDYFVQITLNGMILDKKMLSVIHRIGDERWETLTTMDFLVINALYHEDIMTENMKSRLKRLADIGIAEHIGRNKYVLARSLYSAVGKAGTHTRIVGLMVCKRMFTAKFVAIELQSSCNKWLLSNYFLDLAYSSCKWKKVGIE